MQYFGTHFSAMLPRNMPVTIYYGDDTRNEFSAVLSRPFFGDQLARISSGWLDFVHISGLRAGDTYVVLIRETAGHQHIRFFIVNE
jgi:hypothetical protein